MRGLTESRDRYRVAMALIRASLPGPWCLCVDCINRMDLTAAAASLREVARLCMAEAARLEEDP